MPNFRYLNPSERYSKAVSANGFAFLSAVYALTEGQSVEAQTKEVLQAIDRYLAELGLLRADIVKATVYVADAPDLGRINAVWDEWIAPGPPPARTPVFGPLLRPDAKVGIEVIAAHRE